MAKPIVNGIEKDLEGRAKVVRLNLANSLARNVAKRHGVTALPAMLIFDEAGKLVHRHSGIPSRKRVLEQLSAG